MLVFDFDKTIIECDSDYWVVEEFGVTELFTQLHPTLPWNTLMVSVNLSGFIVPNILLLISVEIMFVLLCNWILILIVIISEIHFPCFFHYILSG